jgi:hypothetical protein
MDAAGPWQGARPSETERCDSSGPLDQSEAASAIGEAIGLADHAATCRDPQVKMPTAGGATISPSSRARSAADLRAGTNPESTRGEPVDPIADLNARLATASDAGAPMSLGRRARVTVRRLPAGVTIWWDARR